MPQQLNIFLLLFGGLQGLLLTLFLVKKKLYKQGNFFLLLYFAVLLLQIVLKVMSKGWLMQNWLQVYLFSYHLPFLYGPLIFLFIRSITGRQNFKAYDVLHFIPVTISFLFNGEVRLLLQLTSIGTYHFLAYRYLQQSPIKWLPKFVIASAVLCTIVAFSIYFMYIYYPSLNWMRMGFLALTAFIYWVSYAALTQPDIFSRTQTNDNLPKLQVHHRPKKYSGSTLSPDESSSIAAILERLMNDTKPYLETGLTIDKLAAMINTNRHHLSQVLNQHIGLSFSDYINTYRVNHARMLLSHEFRSEHKISSIAYDSGFNSLSVFNEVFRKMTGQTPSQYRKHPADLKEMRG